MEMNLVSTITWELLSEILIFKFSVQPKFTLFTSKDSSEKVFMVIDKIMVALKFTGNLTVVDGSSQEGYHKVYIWGQALIKWVFSNLSS